MQIAQILERLELVLRENPTKAVIVYGDVNSALAGALVANKLGIPLIHVEAGLRSFDRTMPEEINRILIDHLSDLHLITCEDARHNLLAEGVRAETIHLVGNPMIDSLRKISETINGSETSNLAAHPYALVTLHRPENVDTDEQVQEIVAALGQASNLIPITLPLHPRGRRRFESAGLGNFAKISIVEPLRYREFVTAMMGARVVITDSGGIQEETSYLGIPCLTLRKNTERPITISSGTNQLVRVSNLVTKLEALLANDPTAKNQPEIPLWDGSSSDRIASILAEWAAKL
jgi:UDP-N-acetylglucosamine 2-epimerase (non-hydrolysing)